MEKILNELHKCFPHEIATINNIKNMESIEEKKEETVSFISRQIKILKAHASNGKTRAAISQLRTLRRKIINEGKESWVKKTFTVAVNLGIGQKITHGIVKTVRMLTTPIPIEIPYVDRVVSFIIHSAIIKPVREFTKWGIETVQESIEVVKETIKAAREEGKGKIKSGLLAVKELGKHVFHKTVDSVVSLAQKTKAKIVTVTTKVVNAVQYATNKAVAIAQKTTQTIKGAVTKFTEFIFG